MYLLFVFALLGFSIAVIWKGSDWLTDSLIPVSKQLGTSYIAVTTLLASFMMSAPELLSSIILFSSGVQRDRHRSNCWFGYD